MIFVLRFPPPIKLTWPPRYNWNIVESGVKHHNHNPSHPRGLYQRDTWYIYIYIYHVIWQVLTLGKREKCRNFWIPAIIEESHSWSHFIPIYNILVCENTVIMVFVKNILLKWTYLTCMPLTLVTRVNTFYPLTFDRLFSIWFPFNNVTLKKIIWNLYPRPRIIKGRLS